jgi:8-oxo-dGTP diphosphatase
MIMHQTPRTTVGVIIVKDRKVLLLKRVENRGPEYRFPGYWCIPGGHVELGETLEQAAIREVKEETGLDVSNLKFLFNIEEMFPEFEWWAVGHTFIAHVNETDVKVQESEISDFKWVTIDEAIKEKLAFETKKGLEKFRDKFGDEL